MADEHVARNPVARAIAIKSMRAALSDFLLSAYLLPDGSRQAEMVMAASTALAVALRVLDARGDGAGIDSRVMAGAMSAMAECSKRGHVWRTRDAPAVDAGLTRALDVLKLATPKEVQNAWLYVRELGREAEAND